MELFIKDRFYIPQLLPQSTKSYMDFNLKRDILNKIALTKEDQELYEIKEDAENNRTTWSAEKDLANPLNVEFSKQEIDFLINACEKLPEAPYPDGFWLTVEKLYEAAQS